MEFLYSGENPIQTGVIPGTIETRRIAVVRGKVLDKADNPLPGVTLTILDHPEFGQTLSRADGMFDMIGGMRTVDGLSNRKVVVAGQVLTSIILFTLVYVLLFAVFVFVLNTKIQHGPDEPKEPSPVPAGGPDGTSGTGFLNAAAALVDRHGKTLASNESENQKEEGR